ncbi:hypothetical protein PsYK624_160910 [Phanerochaete sordida]|uniref:Uncharacterized protein n=1 Tax=Phanerochaete sordida TaxID=48140 RepID=A0A9P3LML3_9APHY|nr:hypothetical protein PsYK624_160910 [Phanerochaete sordida]
MPDADDMERQRGPYDGTKEPNISEDDIDQSNHSTIGVIHIEQEEDDTYDVLIGSADWREASSSTHSTGPHSSSPATSVASLATSVPRAAAASYATPTYYPSPSHFAQAPAPPTYAHSPQEPAGSPAQLTGFYPFHAPDSPPPSAPPSIASRTLRELHIPTLPPRELPGTPLVPPSPLSPTRLSSSSRLTSSRLRTSRRAALTIEAITLPGSPAAAQ